MGDCRVVGLLVNVQHFPTSRSSICSSSSSVGLQQGFVQRSNEKQWQQQQLPTREGCPQKVAARKQSMLTRRKGRILGMGVGEAAAAAAATTPPYKEGGHERFQGKEMHKRRFEYHKGGQTRPARPIPVDNLDVLLFQGFNWESPKRYPWWTYLQSKVEELVELGVTDLWLPPASQSVDKNGYLPGQLYNLDASRYGKSMELRDLIDMLHTHNICAIADIVINHRTAGHQDPRGHWNIFDGGVEDKRLAWGAWAVVDDDAYDSGGQGHHDSGESYAAAPDLDHTQKQVQDELTDWMNWLRAEIGFDGWRFDYAKGYAPEFCGLYCERTNPTFSVGEVWTTLSYEGSRPSANQDAHRQRLCDWIDGTGGRVCAFDFTTKGILQAAVQDELWRLQDSNGKPPGLIGWWPQRAVTFVDNHDTGSTQRHWSFPDNKVAMGYAYILTHPGIPCIFYDHYFEWDLKAQIQELVQIRKRNFINAESKVTILLAESDMYVANIADRVILKLGPRMDMGRLVPSAQDWKLASYGDRFAVWESRQSPPPKIESHFAEPELEWPRIEPSHKVHLIDKMTHRTKKRILEEVPNLVDDDEREKFKDELKY
ncbi:hypothetical protein CY35_19G072200 [Sphagnum magellanicum]|nr:hypothetical protein CY35_19G072200 [Sphagnum magellanicum]